MHYIVRITAVVESDLPPTNPLLLLTVPDEARSKIAKAANLFEGDFGTEVRVVLNEQGEEDISGKVYQIGPFGELTEIL